MITIKHLLTDEVLFISNKLTYKEALNEAIEQSADLYGADLYGADLSSANLYGADLSSANLSSANLSSANLSSANLYGANLSSANLYGANLSSANLYGANLSSANLYGADLYGADLRGANLYGADLYGADLRGANLSSAKNISSLTLSQNSIVSQGDIIGWKKLNGGLICQLLIPKEAKRLNAVGSRKCRAEYANVLTIFYEDKEVNSGTSKHNSDFVYTIGETVKPDSFTDSVFEECSNGIHFFITREEAEAY